MKISEILENMDSFTDAERTKYLGGMFKKISNISKASLSEFQRTWDGSKSFEEFKIAQNKVVRDCIGCEILINDVKEKEGLEIFTLETEI